MWWRQDVHLSLSLCSLITSPYLPPSKPQSLPLQEATCSSACETGREATAGGHSTALQPGTGSPAKPHLHQHRPPQLGLCSVHMPLAQPSAGRKGRYAMALPSDLMWQVLLPLQSHLSPAWSGAAAGRHFGILSNTFKLFGEHSTRWPQVLLNTAVACRCCVSLESPRHFSSNTNHRSS